MPIILYVSAFVFSLMSLSKCELEIEPPVELRWDFSSCGVNGRLGPTQEDCDVTYRDTNLDEKIVVTYGIQKWTVPVSGLYLISARGASGLFLGRKYSGQGAVTTGDFRLRQGEELEILIGQQSDYDPAAGRNKGPGGSGGTFITRVSDGYVLMVAGGGSTGAGNNPAENEKNHADANTDINGKNASKTNENFGLGGIQGNGGVRGFSALNQISSSGGGAGYYSNGNYSYVEAGKFGEVESPSPSISYTSRGVSDNAPGVGGFFMFFDEKTVQNNGGFGGGGSGSFDGGAGGGGGYSGGGGGSWNGWGGGGGSVSNGERPQAISLHRGDGSVTITFIGYSCCGPIVVYIAMCFVAGIIAAILLIYFIYGMFKWLKNRRFNNVEKHDTGSYWTKLKKGVYTLFIESSVMKNDIGFIASGQTSANIFTNTSVNNFSPPNLNVRRNHDNQYRDHSYHDRDNRFHDSNSRDYDDSKKGYKRTRKRDYDHRDYDRSRRRNADKFSMEDKI